MVQVAQQTLRSYRNLVLLRGILALLFGVAVLVVQPVITWLVLVYLFGAFAFVSGIIAAGTALGHTKAEGWALLLVEGILGIAVGIVAFVWPGITAFALLFLIAAWAIVIGVTEIVAAFVLPIGAGREWLLGLAGLASVIFGVLIAVWPRAGLLTVIWLLGIYAIVYGILCIVRYFQVRSWASSLA
jgi:uncharacterized membrane protein HdeD (DUF308 family)